MRIGEFCMKDKTEVGMVIDFFVTNFDEFTFFYSISSEKWIKNDHLAGWDYPASDTVEAARAKLQGRPQTTDSAFPL